MPTPAATDEVRDGARLLARLIEPLVGQVYFSPECHERYEALGLQRQPRRTTAERRRPARRPRLLHEPRLGPRPGARRAGGGRLRGVQRRGRRARRSPSAGRSPTPPPSRTSGLDGAVEQLERILGPAPDGHRPRQRAARPGRRAARALGPGALRRHPRPKPCPGTPLGDLFRLGDRLREFRGDSHIAAWVAAGLDATEIGLLTEPYWGMPTRTYIRTRAWSDAAARRRRGAARGRPATWRTARSPTSGRDAPRGDRAGDRRPDGPRRRRPRRRPRRSSTASSEPWAPSRHGRRRLPPAPSPSPADGRASCGAAAVPERGRRGELEPSARTGPPTRATGGMSAGTWSVNCGGRFSRNDITPSRTSCRPAEVGDGRRVDPVGGHRVVGSPSMRHSICRVIATDTAEVVAAISRGELVGGRQQLVGGVHRSDEPPVEGLLRRRTPGRSSSTPARC